MSTLKQMVPPRIRKKLVPYVDSTLNAALRSKRQALPDEYGSAVASGSVKITLGSGLKPIDGWINTDVVWRGGAYLDATEHWPVTDGSVDFVYADNVIEHLTLQQGREAFRHAFTALKPGGVIRLATPDVEGVARQYLENGELAQLGMARNRDMGRTDFYHPVQLIQQIFVGHKHYLGFCYDYASISTEMERAGFEVHRCEPGVSEYPNSPVSRCACTRPRRRPASSSRASSRRRRPRARRATARSARPRLRRRPSRHGRIRDLATPGTAGFTDLVGATSAEVDLRDRDATFDYLRRVRPDVVVDAAARVGGILANDTYPAEFLSDNLRIQLNVMDAANDLGVDRLLFLGSSCIYPKFAEQPIREDSLLTGALEPTNDAYAIAKIAGIMQVQSARKQYGRRGSRRCRRTSTGPATTSTPPGHTCSRR